MHNGSLSNHNSLRRELKQAGLSFETENDSEVAASYLTWRMREGESLGDALRHSLDDLDGFYTFVVATEDGFGVLRDPVACKPAILAETDDYVAFGSEYRALSGLPGIENGEGVGAGARHRLLLEAWLMTTLVRAGVGDSRLGEVRAVETIDLEVTSLRDLNQMLHGSGRRRQRAAFSRAQSAKAATPSPPASMRRRPSRSTAASATTAPA